MTPGSQTDAQPSQVEILMDANHTSVAGKKAAGGVVLKERHLEMHILDFLVSPTN